MHRAVLAIVGLSACAAPQRPGAARTSFVAMSTVDGATLGAIAGIGACALAGGGEHAPRKLLGVCTAVGAVAGGAATLYGTLQTDTDARIEHWIMVPILPAFYLVTGLQRLIR